MVIPLKYNTASQEIPLGHFLDATDGNTEETGLTIANTDIKLWKAGATTLANKNSGGATHISNGIYYATLDATDTNTYGPLVIFVHVSGALAVKVNCWVMEANAYDAMFAALGSGYVEAGVTRWNGTALSSTNPLPNAAAGAAGGLPTDSTGKTSFNDPTAANIVDEWETQSQADPTGFHVNVMEVSSVAEDIATETKQDVIDANVDAILADTAEIGVAGAGLTEAGGTGDHLTGVPWNAAWDAEVQSECNDALVAYDPPTNTEMTSAFTEIKGATWSSGTDTLEHIRDKQTDIEADTNELQTDNVPGLIAALNNLSAAQVNAEVVDVLKTDTISEMTQQTPPTSPTFEEAIMYLYMALRNKIDVTSSLKEFHNDAGTVIWKKSLSDDGTTYSEAKGASGP